MTIRHHINRRRFVGTATTAIGGLLLPVTHLFGANEKSIRANFQSNAHFWYRKPPDSPYIDSQRGNKAFSFSDNSIFLSEDNSNTWPHSITFPDAKNITFSHIFENGNILFATQAKLYLSPDNLRSYKEIIVKHPDGTDYVPHTPQNPANPGWYFFSLSGVNSWKIGSVEMLVWGNYCNTAGGAAPPNIYYSTDNGWTVKIAYAFGQDPYFRDNGSSGGPTGTLVGNPDNPVFCRHIHCVTYNPAENAFYACTGDGDRPKGMECHWLRGTYNATKDAWNWKVIITEKLNSRYKAGGINFVDGQLYWISDANGRKPYDRGIFRCDPADIAKPGKHTLLFNPNYESANMIIQDGVILAAHYGPIASPFTLGFIISPDIGKTWAEYDLKEFGPRSPSRFHKKNAEGWFRVDLRTSWIDRAEVLFIKPR